MSKVPQLGASLRSGRVAIRALLLVCCVAVSANALAAAPKGSGAFKVVTSPVKNKDYKELQQALDESELLDAIADDLNETIALPFDIAITFEECGTVNAFYDPEDRKISMCLELIENLSEVFHKKMDDTDAADEATMNAAVFVLYHEVGHALVHALDLPITGKEEDAVDQLSTYILADGTDEGETAALDGAEFFVGDEEELDDLAFWDEHSLGQQRFYNIVCWVYGGDPDKHKEMVGEDFLPESRAVRCPGEYEQLSKAWSTLLAPHSKDAK